MIHLFFCSAVRQSTDRLVRAAARQVLSWGLVGCAAAVAWWVAARQVLAVVAYLAWGPL